MLFQHMHAVVSNAGLPTIRVIFHRDRAGDRAVRIPIRDKKKAPKPNDFSWIERSSPEEHPDDLRRPFSQN